MYFNRKPDDMTLVVHRERDHAKVFLVGRIVPAFSLSSAARGRPSNHCAKAASGIFRCIYLLNIIAGYKEMNRIKEDI